MRHPFFNLTHLVLREGESDFSAQHQARGLVATLGPNAAIFARPGTTVSRGPGAKTLARQTPHSIPKRGRFGDELSTFMRVMFGGGDVKLSMIKTLDKQREILLTAGDGAVVEKLDLAEMTREGAPPLQFLQPAFLCSSSKVAFKSAACDASTMSWARAPFVFRAEPVEDFSRPAILCLSGHTLVWSERLEPGESRDFALGNVIAATLNLTSRLRPTSQCHPDDYKAVVYKGEGANNGGRAAMATDAREPGVIARRLRGVGAATKTLLDSMRAREGFFVCEMTNHSNRPAFVYVQLNRGGFYGGTGLIGLMIRLFSAFFRVSHVTMGH
ncbi:MAG: hypothetical protein WAK66_04565 [Methylocystis sp.]